MSSEASTSLAVSGGTLSYEDGVLKLSKSTKVVTKVPLSNVLWASVDDDERIVLSVLTGAKGKLEVKQIEAELVRGSKTEYMLAAEEWTQAVMDLAYAGVKPRRKLRVLINPVGGKGKAKAIYERDVKQIFAAAQCDVETTVTDHQGHMVELAQQVSLDVDAIVILSGDGGVHEVINGLAKHSEAARALRIPIAQVPTGSANAVCINTLGPKDGFNIAKACLNAIKGKPMKQALYSIKQGEHTHLSFLSQAAGLMADLDLGTEHLRWMGDNRFILGYLQGVVTKKICPIEVEYKLVESDKQQLVKTAGANHSKTYFYEEDESHTSEGLPWLTAHEGESSGEWVKFDEPIIYVYGGSMPYVARDLMQFPMADPSDGCVDLVIQSKASRGLMIKATVGAEKGEQFWLPSQRYLKVSAYRAKPLGHGNLAIDGEHYPFEPFELQVHPDILRFLSMEGRYMVEAFDFDHAVHQTS